MRHLTPLLAAALAAGCAAQKLNVPETDGYGSAAELAPSEEERAILADLDAALERAKLPKASVDAAVLAATRARCNAMSEKPGAQAPDEVARGLHAGGVADAIYAVFDVSGSWGKQSLSAEELDGLAKKLAGAKGPLLAGACKLTDGLNSNRHYAVTVVERLAELGKLPRVTAPGSQVSVTASVGEAVSRPAIYVRDPAGEVNEVTAAGGALRHELRTTAEGTYLVEVVGTRDGKRAVLARAAIAAGTEPAEFPAKDPEPKEGEDPPEPPEFKTAGDALAAVQKSLEKVRGSALKEDPVAEKLAGEQAAAIAKEEETGGEALAQRVSAAGLGEVEVISARTPAAEMPLLLKVIEESPFYRRAVRDHTVGLAIARVPKGGDLAMALVVLPGASRAPAAPPPPKEDAAEEDGDSPPPPRSAEPDPEPGSGVPPPPKS